MSSLSPLPLGGVAVQVAGRRRHRMGVGGEEPAVEVSVGAPAAGQMEAGRRRRRSRRAGQSATMEAGRRRRSHKAGQSMEAGRRRRHRKAGQSMKAGQEGARRRRHTRKH